MSLEKYIANRIKAKLISAGTNYLAKKIDQHTGVSVNKSSAKKEVPEIVQKAAIERLKNSLRLAHKKAGVTMGRIEHRYDPETGLHHVSVSHNSKNGDLVGIVAVRQPGVNVEHHEHYPGYKNKSGHDVSAETEVALRIVK